MLLLTTTRGTPTFPSSTPNRSSNHRLAYGIQTCRSNTHSSQRNNSHSLVPGTRTSLFSMRSNRRRIMASNRHNNARWNMNKIKKYSDDDDDWFIIRLCAHCNVTVLEDADPQLQAATTSHAIKNALSDRTQNRYRSS
jgi:hypothetical protein